MSLRVMTTSTGYGEWAHRILSIQSGCSYDGYGDPAAGGCRYCWARANACRFHRKTPETWLEPERVKWPLVHKANWGTFPGTTAYPGTHDISLDLLGPTIELLSHLLAEENRILLVTKPRYSCVKAICDAFADHPYREGILWRFTITSPDDGDLAYWEPNAPPFRERLYALVYAHVRGWATSVNLEPITCRIEAVPAFVDRLRPNVSHSIWLGLMNRAARRVVADPEGRLPALLYDQCPDNVRRLHRRLAGDHLVGPLVRWKNSIKDLVGLPRNPEPGMDC